MPTNATPAPPVSKSKLDEAIDLAKRVEAAQIARALLETHAERRADQELIDELNARAGNVDEGGDDALTELLSLERDADVRNEEAARASEARWNAAPAPDQDIVNLINVRAHGEKE